jgi:oligopeptidase B
MSLGAWSPSSNVFLNLTRTVANKFVKPATARAQPLPFLDGPLVATEAHSGLVLHGKTLKPDPFHYMEDLFDKRTIEACKAEAKHFAMCDMKYDFKYHKARLWLEAESKIVVSSREGGFDKGEERIGDYIYYTRQITPLTPEIGFYRKFFGQIDLLGEELINPTELMQQFGYAECEIGVCRVSQNGALLAYTLSVEGGDRYLCHVRTLDNASIFHVIRGPNIISIEFGSGDQFYYTECNDLNRPYRVMMQRMSPGLLDPPVEIYRDDDESFFVDVRKTKDNKYMIFSSDSKVSGCIKVLPASYPNVPPSLRSFFPGKQLITISTKESWSWLEHYDGNFVMVTSDKGPNFRIVYCRAEVALKHGLKAEWKELIAMQPDVQISDVDLFDGKLIIYECHFKFERVNFVRIVDLSNGGLDKAASTPRSSDALLHFPPLTALTPGLNKNFNQDTCDLMFSSICQPVKECIYNLQMKLNEGQCRAQPPHSLFAQRQAEQFTPWDYQWEYSIYRDVCVSSDGTQIPITIVQRRDAYVEELTDFDPVADNPKHCLMYVYGAYGEVPSMHFQLTPYMWLLRRRWTIAFAHVRGGGERPGWAEAGKGQNKINSVNDFIACCEHMVQNGYTTADKMVAMGSSAGCFPIAAAMNVRGDTLFRAALLRAPFVDVINTMVDPDLPLSLAEREDWGDPLNSPADLEALLKIDPYTNINDRVNYPAMFVSTALDDDRVPPWNALKYVAKLRQQRCARNVDPVQVPLILRCRNRGGHTCWSETRETCEELAWLANLLDLEGAARSVTDMDTMTQTSNLHQSGLIDADDAQKVYLRWAEWEHEMQDFDRKLQKMTFEPNFRKVSTKKSPYFWVPQGEEITQEMVDRIMKEHDELKAKDAVKRAGDSPGDVGKPAGENKYYKEVRGRKQ